jgi:hypothetical protein
VNYDKISLTKEEFLMKRSTVKILVLTFICFLVVGCATLTTPVAINPGPIGSKVGKASGTIWLGVFGNADAGIQTAAKNANITTISTVDITRKLGILGLSMKYEVTVTGE